MASAITFTGLDFTGTPSSDDSNGAKSAVLRENTRRAGLIPPGTPLLVNNAANIKASYLIVLLDKITSVHADNITQSKSDSGFEQVFTPGQIDQIKTNLLTRINGGESASSIIADTATL